MFKFSGLNFVEDVAFMLKSISLQFNVWLFQHYLLERTILFYNELSYMFV